jgi:hypothetical protein
MGRVPLLACTADVDSGVNVKLASIESTIEWRIGLTGVLGVLTVVRTIGSTVERTT